MRGKFSQGWWKGKSERQDGEQGRERESDATVGQQLDRESKMQAYTASNVRVRTPMI